MKYTPGPWTLRRDPCHFDSLSSVVGGAEAEYDKKRRCHVGGLSHALMVEIGGFDADAQEANARLISAAPEMLEALQNLRLLILTLKNTYEDHSAEWLIDSNSFRTAGAAIRKAEG